MTVSRQPRVAARCLMLGAALLLGGCELFSSRETPEVRIAWKVPLPPEEAQWPGRPALFGTTVIAQTGGSLTAFDLVTGAILWKTTLRTGYPINADNVVAAAGRAYTAGGDSVYAVDAATGQRLWTFLPDQQAALSESYADDAGVYIGTRSRMVYALTADSGRVRWAVNIGPGWVDSGLVRGIAGSGDTIYVGAVQNLNPSTQLRTAHIVALDRQTGQELWRYTVPDDANDVNSAPGMAGDQLLFGDVYGSSFFAVNRFTGAETWRVHTYLNAVGVSLAPVASGDQVYAAGQGGVYAVNLATGRRTWTREGLPYVGGNHVLLCGNQLLLQNFTARLLRRDDGSELNALFEDDPETFLSSALVASGDRAFAIGSKGAYGFVCGRGEG